MEDDYLEFNRLQREKKKLNARNDFQELSRVCNRCGEILYRQGKFQEALEEHREEEEACLRAKDVLGVGNANRRIGECYAELGEYEEAIKHQRKHLELATEVKSVLEQQRAWATLGRTYLFQAETMNTANKLSDIEINSFSVVLDKAEEAFHKGLQMCSKLSLADVTNFELEQMKGRLFLNLGLIKDYRSDLSGCVSSIEKAIEIHRSQSQWEDLFRSHHSLSLIYLKRDDTSNSLYHAEEALKIAKRLNDTEHEYEILSHTGLILLHQERYSEAKSILRKCYKLAQLTGQEMVSTKRLLKFASNLNEEKELLNAMDPNNTKERMVIAEKLGDLASSAEIYKSALGYYHLALQSSKLLGNTNRSLAPLYVSLAQTYADDHQYENALRYYNLELQCWENSPEEKCKTLMNLADCESRVNYSYEKIISVYNNAFEEAEKSGNRLLQKSCLKSLAEFQSSQNKFDDMRITEANLEEYKDVSSEEELSSDGDNSSLFLSDSNEESERESPKQKKIANRTKSKRSRPLRKNEKGETPLHRACIAGQLNTVKRLIQQGHPVNVRDHSGWLPIHEASNHGFPEICRLLLENGANANDRGGDHCEGITPLHDAALNCHLEVMEVLLEFGASCLAKNDKGLTPLDCLAEWRRTHKQDADPEYLSASLRFEEKLRLKINNSNFTPDLSGDRSKLLKKNEFRTKQFKVNAHNEMELNSSDCDSDPPAVVGEEYVLPDCDDWIIDDVNTNKEQRQRKRRKYNILDFVERSATKSCESNSFTRELNLRKHKSPDRIRRCFNTRKRKRSNENRASSPSSSVETLPVFECDTAAEMVENERETTTVEMRTRVNVKVLEALFLISIPQGETIGWLANEAAERYFIFSGQKPKLILSLGEDAVLPLEDKVNVILRNGDEVTANFLSWEILPVDERYFEACKNMKIDVDEKVRGALIKAESFALANFAKFNLESLRCSTVLRALHCMSNIREINLSGNYFEPQHLQLLASLLKLLPLLHSLDVSNCDITDSSLNYLIEHFKHKSFVKLEHLKIGYNPLLDEGCKNLSSLFKYSPNLSSVSIPSISTSSALCHPMDGKHLVEALSVAHCLRKLDLSYTKYSIAVLLEIIATLSRIPLLELDLSSVVLKSDVKLMCHSLSEWMREPTTVVEVLHLSMCYLNDECIRILLPGLQKRNLNLLNVSGNRDLSSSSVALLLEFMPKEKLILTSCPISNCVTTAVNTIADFSDCEEELQDAEDCMEISSSPVF